ncbi:calcium-binding protein [Ruegeria aquimaris]|uniref:Bifunctional hemolysin/adenylate cyclase n=1 Tax=Ruegeria aquimaris TaxID=2984333 RepID=A0ABT3AIH6_9RHOB|nr:calcium-binding protein [Ruegeria sp. XHP0148]MCV2888454.1 hypothetical protein [Ruegeria sp. XHP0148]
MTTYSLPGIKIIRDASDVITDVIRVTLDLFVNEGGATTLSYSLSPTSSGGILPAADVTSSGIVSAVFSDGVSTEVTDSFIGQMIRGTEVTQILNFTNNTTPIPENYLFRIGGVELPPITTPAEAAAIEASITGGGAITTGPLAPGAVIDITGFPDISSTENDRVTGTAGSDTFLTGDGNDQIISRGGDDLINPGDNRLFDGVAAGAGTDRVILSDMHSGYVEFLHFDLNAGIVANIDGAANTATIDKGANGTTTIVDIATPMLGDALNINGVALFGTAHDDVFNVTVADNGWTQLDGEGGNDIFNIGASTGSFLRLTYSNAPGGVVADLAARTISSDGYGGSDTITGPGQVQGLRSSMHDDSVTGGAGDESFILMAGNDTLDAGAGVDQLRYDRTGVGAVTLDLGAGTATGIWRGVAFHHTISNVERVHGSRADNDSLIGKDGVNVAFNGFGGNDTLIGRDGDDSLLGGAGDDSIDGGAGQDLASFDVASTGITVIKSGEVYTIVSAEGTDMVTNVERFEFTDATLNLAQMDDKAGIVPPPVVETGGDGPDTITGGSNDDRLLGAGGDDLLIGGDGADTLNGGDGNDTILGGDSSGDLRDIVYAGGGDDSVDGGYGNDLLFGQDGNDTIAGGFGVDEIQGQDGNDVITGSAFSDLVYGGAGDDFVNGGFGHDRINGGSGADKFFHVGVEGHGSDWVQDYNSAEGDMLLFGNTAATRADFQVNFAHTQNAEGERAGDDAVQEAFVIYRPTGQIMWALVDGEGQSSINLQIGSEVFDLLA